MFRSCKIFFMKPEGDFCIEGRTKFTKQILYYANDHIQKEYSYCFVR